MAASAPIRVKSITEFHRMHGLPMPEHPLISVVDIASFSHSPDENIVQDFYAISLKRIPDIKFKYGQQEYDFNEGVMFFMSPNQVFGFKIGKPLTTESSGWVLLIHPSFLWNTPLAKNIKQYEFFDYSANEALWLSEKEEKMLNNLIKNIQIEYHSNIDKFSQQIIISQIETLLNYSERFYGRQFITRKISNHEILSRMEELISDYFNSVDLLTKGLPSVQHIANTLNVSPKYLSSLLKVLTGQNTQQHIHEKLIEVAKEKLSTTDLSINEIAYGLGFEHSQSFSKLFKAKTKQSPLAFRTGFNLRRA